MRKVFLISLFLLLPSYAMAQVSKTTPQAPTGQPGTWGAYVDTRLDDRFKIAEEKAKPVIITEAKKQVLIIASLQLENAKLKLAESQANVTKAEQNVADFWKSVGINPAELTAKWDISDGQNGDIILTPKKEPEKTVEPKPKSP